MTSGHYEQAPSVISGRVSQNSAFEPGGLWWCDCGERRNNRSDCSLPAVEPRAARSQLQRCDASARLGNITRQVLENIRNLRQQTVTSESKTLAIVVDRW